MPKPSKQTHDPCPQCGTSSVIAGSTWTKQGRRRLRACPSCRFRWVTVEVALAARVTGLRGLGAVEEPSSGVDTAAALRFICDHNQCNDACLQTSSKGDGLSRCQSILACVLDLMGVRAGDAPMFEPGRWEPVQQSQEDPACR